MNNDEPVARIIDDARGVDKLLAFIVISAVAFWVFVIIFLIKWTGGGE